MSQIYFIGLAGQRCPDVKSELNVLEVLLLYSDIVILPALKDRALRCIWVIKISVLREFYDEKILLSSLLLSTSVDVVITDAQADTHSLSVVRQKILRITGI